MEERERTEAGRAILDRQRAQGEPGTKQPAHENPAREAERTIQALDELRTDLGVETMGPSKERAKQPGNPHPIAPQDRLPAAGPAQTAAADIAAGHISAAQTAIETQLTSEARIKSDPRHERDQKVYELGQTGKLGLVPPTEAEVAATAQRAGLTPEVADKIPKTAEEQVAEDTKRLSIAEERAQTGATMVGSGVMQPSRESPIRAGEQENNTPANNLERMVAAGKQIGGAEGEKQRQEDAERKRREEAESAKSTTIK